MALKHTATANHVGRDVTASIPAEADGVFGLASGLGDELDGELARIWPRAAGHLRVRSNDAHTLYAVAIARSLLAAHPEADAGVVLPAIMLHDIGWSRVPPDEVLEAIAPGGGRPDLVLLHEKEGARLAAEILAEAGVPAERAARIVEIIDGHDSRREALSIEDAIVRTLTRRGGSPRTGWTPSWTGSAWTAGRPCACAPRACTPTSSRTPRRRSRAASRPSNRRTSGPSGRR